MTRTFSLAAALLVLAAAPGAAAPITAEDGAGRVYQLTPDGTWWDEDEAVSLDKRFLAFLDTAQQKEKRRAIAEDWPKYRDCLANSFRDLPIPARRMIVSGSDPREVFKKLEETFPDAASLLGERDRSCRRDIRFE